MKIILSVDSVRFPLTGIGRYTYELAQHLRAVNELDLQLFSNGNFISSLPDKETLNNGHDNEKLNSKIIHRVRKVALQSNVVTATYQFLSERRNRQVLNSHHDAIFHGPGFYLPPFQGRSVATFHDLSIFKWEHCHPPERVRYMQHQLLLTLERASMLITDSEFNRQELSEFFNYPLERIRAVPLAGGSEFYPRIELELNPILNCYGLDYRGYTLFTGTIEPRKNLTALLDAYDMLPAYIRKRWPLVLVGHHGWKSETTHDHIQQGVAAGWIKYLGYVPSDDLPMLFAGARLFVFPSHYEGFGLPVLEAMASGIPVICSNVSSLPEVAGDAAAMFAPDDVDKLRQLIDKGLQDEFWRKNAIAAGLRQSKKFSWNKCAEETAAVYREVAQLS